MGLVLKKRFRRASDRVAKDDTTAPKMNDEVSEPSAIQPQATPANNDIRPITI